jgi:transcriptional regulator GlxA family with amidase domain
MKTVDVLLYEGVDELDFCGPFEVLASCRRLIDGKWSDKPAFHVETVAEHRSTVQCAHGLCLLPDKALAQAREADIIVIPGGPGVRKENVSLLIMEFLRKAHDTAEVMACVGTGVYLLAKAGLADNHQVTTHTARQEDLAKTYPKTRVVRGPRVVTSGKDQNIMTSVGISAGVDLALALITRFEGRETARMAARRLEWPGSV